MSRHDRFISKAIEATGLSQCRFMVAAIVVKSGRVLSVGANRWRCPTKILEAGMTYHAEVQALKGVSFIQARGATLYIARKGRNGKPSMARPCDSCWAYILDHHVRQVVYTTWEDGYALESTRWKRES